MILLLHPIIGISTREHGKGELLEVLTLTLNSKLILDIMIFIRRCDTRYRVVSQRHGYVEPPSAEGPAFFSQDRGDGGAKHVSFDGHLYSLLLLLHDSYW